MSKPLQDMAIPARGWSFWRRVARGMSFGSSWTNRLAVLLIVAAAGSGIATYGALTDAPPFGKDSDTVIWLLNIDLIILLLLGSLTARRLASLWTGRRKGIAGSRLHVRLVFVFSLIAAVPAIIMAIFSAYFMQFGVQSWFGERVSMAVNESQAVAEAYLDEHLQVIRADVLAMASDLDRQASLLTENPQAFNRVVETQSLLRNLSEAMVFDSAGRVLAHSDMTFSLAFETLPAETMDKADGGDVVVMAGEEDDRVRALVRLNNFIDAYLFVGRMVDQTVLSHVTDTRKAAQEYQKLESQRSRLQVKITLIFIVVALLLLFAAVWFGLIFARQLILPVSALIMATEKIREGNLTARVPEMNRRDEFDILAKAFNGMARELDERQRFIETVLAGVSSGIVGVDATGSIGLANASAGEIFGCDHVALRGRNIAEILPAIEEPLMRAMGGAGKITQMEMPYSLGKEIGRRMLLVRIAVDPGSSAGVAAVLTFDDITEIQAAQRKAAWADVARRIAHEIKNPLTPIQLSAERLKRRYLKQITEGADVFAQCTDTIINHVGDIGRMVNEFSAFARMPEPIMKDEDIVTLVRDIAALQQQAHPDIVFSFGADGDAINANIDAQQIRQAVTNIIQNSVDSVQGLKPASIDVNVLRENSKKPGLFIVVSDNGSGFPKGEDLTRLTEPYVTHKARGTGLGLAIVKKIMEDHGGRLVLGTPDWLGSTPGWRNAGGATVILAFPPQSVSTEIEPARIIA